MIQRKTCQVATVQKVIVFMNPDNFQKGCQRNFAPQDCDQTMPEMDHFDFHEMETCNWTGGDYEHSIHENEADCRQILLNKSTITTH
ncbi:hypothetical protein PanWU01x14_207380 [Parasponia andersonii]|uniref:Uncharacterized protein n=1 Tax=Parasponia andersonii TaxID=3476 RepID=A0A2P5BV12_PARAD|nr:hypothetical protein PanWU01x14_207380 [Parasponia andersonii]